MKLNTVCNGRRNKLKAMVYLIMFSPLIDVGLMHLRIDQMVIIVYLGLNLFYNFSKGKVNINKMLLGMVFFVSLLSLAALISIITTGTFSLSYVINFPVKILIYFIISYYLASFLIIEFSHFEFMNILLNASFIVAIIGIIQYFEFVNLLPTNIISSFINSVYPFKGEMSEIAIQKAGGLLLKTGGAGRITSTFEGHPILLGNFFALIIPITVTITNKPINLFKWGTILVALLLTLSRGSIISAFVGIVSYQIILNIIYHKTGARQLVKYAIICTIIFILIDYGYLESISWRFLGTIETFKGAGIDEGRISVVWPNAFSHISAYGLIGWIFGVGTNYNYSTDSMYLLLLINVGIFGLVAFVIYHINIIKDAIKFLIKKVSQDKYINLFMLSIISTTIALLINYIVHPMWQGDRFLSMFFLIISYMYLIINKSENQKKEGGEDENLNSI